MPETLTDILPLTAFRDNPTEPLDQLRTTRRPITLTVDGKPAAILQDPAEHQSLLDIADEADAREGIRRGLADIAAGRTRPAREVLTELDKEYHIPR